MNPKSVVLGIGIIPREMIVLTDQSLSLCQCVIYRSRGITVHEFHCALSLPEKNLLSPPS